MDHQAEVDVIVVGAGGSGLVAAVSAAEKGATVLVLETKGSPGGATNFPAGLLAVESNVQEKQGISLTKAEVFAGMMEYSHFRSNAALTEAIVGASSSTVAWLQKLGVVFSGVMPIGPNSAPTWHLIQGTGRAMVNALVAEARRLNVRLIFKATPTSLLVNEGCICGVTAEIEGRSVEFRSKAVILATGGYTNNKEWVKKYTGFDLNKNLFPTVNLGLMGGGHTLAWDAGAAREGLGLLEIEIDLVGPGLSGKQLKKLALQPLLWVNSQGERLGNEETIAFPPMHAGNTITRQSDRQAFVVFDSATKQLLQTQGFLPVGPFSSGPPPQNMPAQGPEAGAMPPGMPMPPAGALPPGMPMPPSGALPPGFPTSPMGAMPPAGAMPPGMPMPPGGALPPGMPMPPGGGIPAGMPLPDGLDAGPILIELDEQIEAARVAGNTNVFSALSLEDLCSQTGINHAGLLETLTRYNHMAASGRDDQFGKSASLLLPVAQPPYYALRIYATALGTLGGIKVNAHLEVLNASDRIIPGLYAVGNIAAGMHGDTYCMRYPGTTLGFAMNSGRIAGEHAASAIRHRK